MSYSVTVLVVAPKELKFAKFWSTCGAGYRACTFNAAELIRLEGILLPGNGSRTGFAEPGMVWVVAGSKISAESREKSPCLKAAVGTVMLVKAAAPFMDVL